MGLDISTILSEWPYEPGQVTVRRIRGADGREKIQLRLDLGLLQMETTGRPDGLHPHGAESLFQYHHRRLERHTREHGSEEGFSLDGGVCEKLRSEAVMYYHRYLAEYVLEDYEAVERDTRRNLHVMDFMKAYAEEPSDQTMMEQYRPYVLMMSARSRGQLALQRERPKLAMEVVRGAVQAIRDFYRETGREELIDVSGELAVLRAFRKEIQQAIPVDPAERLRREMEKAVHDERYEDAARLRDELHKLQHTHADGGGT